MNHKIENLMPVRMQVFLGDMEVAQLVRAPGERVAMRVTDEAALSRVAPVVEGALESVEFLPASLRVRNTPVSFNGIPGWLADSLPDNWGSKMLRRFLEERVSDDPDAGERAERVSSDLLTMLAFVGGDSQVGIHFKPEHGHGVDVPVALDLIAAVREARMVESKAALAGDLSQLRGGWSVGGARPKTNVGFGPSGELVAGCGVADLCKNGYSPWILKLGNDVVGLNNMHDESGRVEFAYYKMATDCGIPMSECRLHSDSAGVGHFLTKRFDRDISPASRIPFRSLAGLLNRDKAEPVSYEQHWRVRREVEASDAGAKDFFRRMCFNIIASVRDDHSRNFGFLHTPGGWVASPAFDIMVTDASEHSSTVGGRGAKHTRKALVAFATERLGLKKDEADELLNQVVAMGERWPEYATASGVGEENTEYFRKRIEKIIQGIRESGVR